MRLNRGGNRQANAALYLVATVRMQTTKKTKIYVAEEPQKAKHGARQRCLKRYIVREIYHYLCVPPTAESNT